MIKLVPDAKLDSIRNAVDDAARKAEAAVAEAAQVRKELGEKIDALASNVSKLASARLLQQAFTSLVLAGALTVLIQALHG